MAKITRITIQSIREKKKCNAVCIKVCTGRNNNVQKCTLRCHLVYTKMYSGVHKNVRTCTFLVLFRADVEAVDKANHAVTRDVVFPRFVTSLSVQRLCDVG